MSNQPPEKKSLEEKLRIIGNGFMALGCLVLLLLVIVIVIGSWLYS